MGGTVQYRAGVMVDQTEKLQSSGQLVAITPSAAKDLEF
jgi:hypothetical protein